MSERSDIITDFLAQSRWAGWNRTSLIADASARQYERLEQNGETVILMDAPPENGESTATFTKQATYLAECGLCPPDILAQNHEIGLLVLSDLGSDDYAKWLKAKPHDNKTLYKAAIDVLIKLQTYQIPDDLIRMTPELGADMIMITGDHYAKTNLVDLKEELQKTLQQFAPDADTYSMRDFHAENLIWRPDLSGTARVGLLDFQDAFIAPNGYDLASLLRDARRDLDPSFVEDMIVYFLEETQYNESFRAQLACLGVQRNLRILGVFARLATHANKKRYVDLIPRVWYNLQQDLTHPDLKQLQQAVGDCMPAPDTAFLERLRQ